MSGDGAALIGVDWGTTNMRVLRMAPGGRLLAMRADARGASVVTRDAFAEVLAEVAGDWLDQGLPLLSCGMAGARGKWREMPYLPAPVSLSDLAAALASPPERSDFRIIPGVQRADAGRMADVMRGEETQVMGLDLEPGHHLVVAPGTHSKWIRVEPGRIIDHLTFMTGELFAAIRKGTLMGADMGDPGKDDEAFDAGVERGLSDPALTAALFSVRVETLADRLDGDSAADYLSGLLIGAEVAAQRAKRDTPVVLVGGAALNIRYGRALALADFDKVRAVHGDEATARGLWRIHEAARR